MNDAMKRYYFYKSHGICVQCGSQTAQKGKTRCSTCAATHSDYASISYFRWKDNASSEEVRERYNARNIKKMKTYYFRKQNGLCVKCGTVSDGKTMCRHCRLKYNYWRREHDRKKLKIGGADNG
jgi:DNA polymerase II small subunit/DNA polymerase delta subunit B